VASALLDTGPVVALINRSDRNHQRAAACFRAYRGTLWSTAAVVTEVTYVLAPSLAHQTAALTWLQRGVQAGLLHIEGIGDLGRIAELMAKYEDFPADFADICLVHLGQQKRIDKILTVDVRDFSVYRSYAGKRFRNLFM
jgi:uncharacterized protein